VAQLGERNRGTGDLDKGRSPLGDEALEPAERGPLEPGTSRSASKAQSLNASWRLS
jgi:hypothetical protein